MNAQSQAVVPVKSAWASKVNWAQVVASTSALGVLFMVDASPEAKAQIVTGITTAFAAITIVCRTFYNASVTPESLK